jgi:hypothetical protein
MGKSTEVLQKQVLLEIRYSPEVADAECQTEKSSVYLTIRYIKDTYAPRKRGLIAQQARNLITGYSKEQWTMRQKTATRHRQQQLCHCWQSHGRLA